MLAILEALVAALLLYAAIALIPSVATWKPKRSPLSSSCIFSEIGGGERLARCDDGFVYIVADG